MKLIPSKTMTVDSLGAEIRRQADYHAAQAYPFPELTMAFSMLCDNNRYGRIELTAAGNPSAVVVWLKGGIARLCRLPDASAHVSHSLGHSNDEAFAASYAMLPFLPDDEKSNDGCAGSDGDGRPFGGPYEYEGPVITT